MQTNEQLIRKLVSDAKPIQRLLPPARRFLNWLCFALLCVGVSLSVYGLRMDLNHRMADWAFVIESAVILVLALSGALSAFFLSIPGREKSALTRWLPVVPLSGWTLLLLGRGTRMFLDEQPLDHAQMLRDASLGMACSVDIGIMGVLPGILLVIMLRRAAPLRLDWSGALLFLSVTALGAFALQFVCTNSRPIHLLVWHFLPVAVLGVLGVIVGSALLSRKQPDFGQSTEK